MFFSPFRWFRDKKFNSLKKTSSRKAAKEEQQENNHVASLDRKYLKFLSGSGKQNFNPVPTAQFRSYRRVAPMERPPFSAQDSALATDLRCVSEFGLYCLYSPPTLRNVTNVLSVFPNSICSRSDSMPTVPVPSASPTRPPDMADYRLASLAKCSVNNQR